MRRSRPSSMAHTMRGTMDRKQHKSCQKRNSAMNVAGNARDMIALLAGPRAWGDTRERWLEKAARRLGWPYCRTRGVFYRRVRLTVEEWLDLNEQIDVLKNSAARRMETINEIEALERAAVAAGGNSVRPLELEGDAAGEARHRTKRTA